MGPGLGGLPVGAIRTKFRAYWQGKGRVLPGQGQGKAKHACRRLRGLPMACQAHAHASPHWATPDHTHANAAPHQATPARPAQPPHNFTHTRTRQLIPDQKSPSMKTSESSFLLSLLLSFLPSFLLSSLLPSLLFLLLLYFFLSLIITLLKGSQNISRFWRF